MSDAESEVLRVVERAFATTVPDAPIEFLLADNSQAHLRRMAFYSPTGNPPGCTVDSPSGCPAARRGQTQRFSDSRALDVCNKLRNDPNDPYCAVCVPVSVMGRTVGVLHAVSPVDVPLPESRVSDLETLAKLTGARIGLLRVMSETQLQATTDNLTGLWNRRSFEEQLNASRDHCSSVALAMADLDRFKSLNDTYGHATGDRALRLFAQTLTSAVRGGDLVCRYGGEEFVIAFLNCTAPNAYRAVQAFRSRLEAALTTAGLPNFTASFGLIDMVPSEDLDREVARVDSALFAAKRGGRDQIVVHDAAGSKIELDGDCFDSRSRDFDHKARAIAP